jgi:hypothetical protein
MFENVQFFSHLHFKIAKSAIMTQKFFFLKNINMGIKKTQNFMLISKEGGLYYIGGAYILVFIGNGANLAHLFRKRAKRQK